MMSEKLIFMPAGGAHPFRDQSEDGEGRVGQYRFVAQDPTGVADSLVVVEEVSEELLTRIPRERRIFFVSEPYTVKKYPQEFLAQFGMMVCPYKIRDYKGKQIFHPSQLSWWFGANTLYAFDNTKNVEADSMSYAEHVALKPPTKDRVISVICSNKTMTREHDKRVGFVEILKRHFQERLDVFGRGQPVAPNGRGGPIDDKAEAILPYRYHIALENNAIDGFWTEKLADCYLGYAFPIYGGCRDVGKYFPEGSYRAIDMERPEAAIEIIEDVLAQDPYQERLRDVIAARHKVLTEYNRLFLAAKLVAELPDVKPLAQPETLRGYQYFRKLKTPGVLYHRALRKIFGYP